MTRKLVVGSRGSRLALIQAESVVVRLRELNPHLEVSLSKIVTTGDRDRRTQLDQMAGVGVFVKELEEALLAGRIDLAVHSLKDMPTEIPHGLELLAAMERLDPRDVLVARARLDELAPASRIGTGSLRRAVQLTQYRPDLEVVSIRGNVDSRMRKVSAGEVDGVLLAAAAIIRLGREKEITEYLPLERFLPAVGQGALAIEARLGDEEVARFVSPLNHLPTWQSTMAERAFLAALGGGCRAPIAALGTVKDNVLKLAGMVADASGRKMLSATEEGNAMLAEEVGRRLAEKMLQAGASVFVNDVRSR
ncbi:MAG: Porphobilinogen deaminase [Dehalococcoidales bacterium]|nr:Porphobilinogen deaminase [Dehalococcoidales bacterium]